MVSSFICNFLALTLGIVVVGGGCGCGCCPAFTPKMVCRQGVASPGCVARQGNLHYIKKLVNCWRSRYHLFSTPFFLLATIALTVTNILSACLLDFCVGQSNPGTFGVALITSRSGHCGSWMPLLWCISDQLSAAPSSSLSFGTLKSLFLLSPYFES